MLWKFWLKLNSDFTEIKNNQDIIFANISNTSKSSSTSGENDLEGEIYINDEWSDEPSIDDIL